MVPEPLANRMRPRTFEEVAGQRHLFGRGEAPHRRSSAPGRCRR